MYWTTKALMTCNWQKLLIQNDSCLSKSICTLHVKTPGLRQKKLALYLYGISFRRSSVPMQAGSGSLLQIESSLPARAAKQLLIALQAIIATPIYSECQLDLHYNARCHICFSFEELGLLEKLELVIVSSYYTALISQDVGFPTFKVSSFMVSGKRCSYESYNAIL